MATVVGEVTNPMQQLWLISKDVGQLEFHNKLSPVFTYFFVIVRCVLTPLWSSDVIVSQANAFTSPPICKPPRFEFSYL